MRMSCRGVGVLVKTSNGKCKSDSESENKRHVE